MKWWKCETCISGGGPPCFAAMPDRDDPTACLQGDGHAAWQPCGPAPHEPMKVDDTPLSVQMESLAMTVVRDNGEPEEITIKVKDTASVTAAEVNAQLRAQGLDPSMVASVTPMMAWTEAEMRAERLQKKCDEWERCVRYLARKEQRLTVVDCDDGTVVVDAGKHYCDFSAHDYTLLDALCNIAKMVDDAEFDPE